jgi:hypothetical protein
MYTFILENVQESSPKLTKMAYLKKIMLHFKLLTIVADQVVDTILVVSLFLMQEHWFALVYLAVDIFPAVVVMWHMFQRKRSWKVLVCHILSLHFNLDICEFN